MRPGTTRLRAGVGGRNGGKGSTAHSVAKRIPLIQKYRKAQTAEKGGGANGPVKPV